MIFFSLRRTFLRLSTHRSPPPPPPNPRQLLYYPILHAPTKTHIYQPLPKTYPTPPLHYCAYQNPIINTGPSTAPPFLLARSLVCLSVCLPACRLPSSSPSWTRISKALQIHRPYTSCVTTVIFGSYSHPPAHPRTYNQQFCLTQQVRLF